jgi:hypothetical protein
MSESFLTINLNTLISTFVSIGVGGVYYEFRKLNGAVKSLVQWKEDHIHEHDEAKEAQKEFCNLRHRGMS